VDFAAAPPTISEITRRDITDVIAVGELWWPGRLGEVDFLERLYDLEALPSTDSRFPNAFGDVWQHRVNNPQDWPDDWVFRDSRFALVDGPDETFIAFLAEMLHPAVRSDEDEVAELAALFNDYLRRDGWELVVCRRISGRPVFAGRRCQGFKAPAAALELEAYQRLGEPGVLRDHLQRIERGLQEDPAEAIASSKELVETVCRFVLEDYGIDYSPKDDVLDLYKKVAGALALGAESVPDSAKGSSAAQRTLRTLVTTIQSLAELRNALGLGHGRTRKSPALTRHGRLAFNAAITVTEFLLDTWHVRRANEPPASRAGAGLAASSS
jgi:hypothetical protein